MTPQTASHVAPHAAAIDRHRFTVRSLETLTAAERGLTVLEAGFDSSDILDDMQARFRAVGAAAADVGLATVQELAAQAENLVGAYRQRPMTLGSEQVDVLRHAIDVLSLMVLDVRRRLEARPAANVGAAVVAVTERIAYARREAARMQ